MPEVLVIGGGPAGLRTALFTAKNGLDTTVFDTDETWMHNAHLFNYPGIGSADGSNVRVTLREQVDDFDVDRHQETPVTAVSPTDDGFVVETADADNEYTADYVVLATGANRELTDELDCVCTDEEVIDADVTMETSVEDAYPTGAMVRVEEWQAVISTGDGAAAALNILTKENGEQFHDFDVPAVDFLSTWLSTASARIRPYSCCSRSGTPIA
ncbi:thioredoxin reductase [Salinigranum rubrum]|uniref:Thioredoxin reductase n=1 Tax=Salinigranum rubrum TaxID=755307 RepID=A0A2I8VKQ8_9EURY|nr:FAD-dependent oxidoreductase [Salinigranum rubrum]AUV82474.1 thioredoxin reductase [Salinigranum rubrum]